jgi:hypothetical protein
MNVIVDPAALIARGRTWTPCRRIARGLEPMSASRPLSRRPSLESTVLPISSVAVRTLKRSRPSCCGSGACREPIARWTYWLRRARARSESPRWRHRPRARARLGSRRVGGRRCCGADARRRPGPARSRNARRLKRPGGEHDLAGLVRAVVGLDEVAARACLHGPHERVELDGSLEVACIVAEVADDLVARPVVVGVSGERPARKAVVAGGGEQRQRVPARGPRRCRSYLCQRWLRSFQSSVQCLCLAV